MVKVKDLEKYMKSKERKKNIVTVKRLKKDTKKTIPDATNKELSWAVNKASEYNPIHFKEAKGFMVKLIRKRRRK